MLVSLNEVEVMATKAACGSGRPWGLAQETGWAVARLEAQHLPGVDALLALLEATDGFAGYREQCPILVGCHIADLGGVDGQVTHPQVCQPLLLVPFLQRVAGSHALQCGQCRITVMPDAVDICGALPAASAVSITRIDGPAVAGGVPLMADMDIDGEIWEALGVFAHRTYVPATDASRLKGAGAGLNDND